MQENKRLRDVNARIANNVRARLAIFLKTSRIRKTNSTFELIGCTPDFLRQHLESMWKSGMCWGNYIQSGWHIDHIRPLCTFDLSNPEQLRMAANYTNLQPLWAHENFTKAKSRFR